MRSNFGPPMTLANMRQNGVRVVTARCEACGREADVNVDILPETMTVPRAGQRLRCSGCGGKRIVTRPAWHAGTQRHGVPDPRPERPGAD
jgi:DNA-directed RNA polymerase subunit RPC12/RpoP